METIAEAKQHLKDNWVKGVSCPCCTQFVKLYKRKLNSGMAVTLIRIYRQGIGYIHVKEYLRKNSFHNGHDWTLLLHWGLLENKEPDKTKDEKCSGMWRITPKGINFVRNMITVDKCVKLFNSNLYGFDGRQINIINALGDKFSYHELMKVESNGQLAFLC